MHTKMCMRVRVHQLQIRRWQSQFSLIFIIDSYTMMQTAKQSVVVLWFCFLLVRLACSSIRFWFTFKSLVPFNYNSCAPSSFITCYTCTTEYSWANAFSVLTWLCRLINRRSRRFSVLVVCTLWVFWEWSKMRSFGPFAFTVEDEYLFATNS